jgi:hypothetical protein
MEKFLYADTDEKLAEVVAKIEVILINSWLGLYNLSMFPSILCVDCRGESLLEISKFYRNLYISSLNYQKEFLIYEKVIHTYLFSIQKMNFYFYYSD